MNTSEFDEMFNMLSSEDILDILASGDKDDALHKLIHPLTKLNYINNNHKIMKVGLTFFLNGKKEE